MPGKGNIIVTGNLKSVMQESAATALSFVRSKAERLELDPEFLKTIDLHIHVPKGGTPKDGPSAGVTHVRRRRLAAPQRGRSSATSR